MESGQFEDGARNSSCIYRSATTLAFCAMLLCLVQALTDAMAAFSVAARIQFLDAARFATTVSTSEAAAHDNRQHLIAWFQLPADILGLVLFLMWVYRANRNARALGAEHMQYTPGWSVGWFFVPLAGLVKPYFVLQEIWKASASLSGKRWRETNGSPFVGVWWVACVIAGMSHYTPFRIVLGNLDMAKMLSYDGFWISSLLEDSWFLLFTNLLEVALQALDMALILWITVLQERKQEMVLLQTDTDALQLIDRHPA